ncbi:NAD(P)-dependent dehydrogenase, short-chain alcohol dehydrogenase family [Anaerosphaera aminiphila DSM 21120]|uniref:NAD(P)-dependent dehydrogenase, short-chain alcohol dehydrogenase family n=1 Tax=Anaerosphaera aminiphila DSM 21120 TaxID=1120995 RepID=A0A1M5V0S1_9FIRM|nr:SDR family NAD(P)-dependent oxidoreductase [Anaerosphaera aminiphila]SHH68734.1 NAD(P)-dependent dehydrogenase, short-chain alcohol dehydrogenase family [Anaerosphaera aminiphila DSM 21120]
MRLEDKIVILTGASSGIGRATALRFAKEGAKVIAMARRKERLDELAGEAKDFAGEIIPYVGDVSKDEDIKGVVAMAITKYNRVDVLINNAGILDKMKTASDIDDELWDKILNVNVTGVMKMIREVIPHMVEQKSGSIVNTASVGGLFGGRGGMAYVASKHAVIGMTKHIGFEFQEYGIRCNAVAPGSVATEVFGTGEGVNQSVMEKLNKGVAVLPVLGKAEEIANVMLFLASDEASFVNGAVVVADGGWTAF